MAVTGPMNGFDRGRGALYAYKVGHDPETIDRPDRGLDPIPRHCLLTKEQFEPLLARLFHSCQAEWTAGFVYHPNEWELIRAETFLPLAAEASCKARLGAGGVEKGG